MLQTLSKSKECFWNLSTSCIGGYEIVFPSTIGGCKIKPLKVVVVLMLVISNCPGRQNKYFISKKAELSCLLVFVFLVLRNILVVLVG